MSKTRQLVFLAILGSLLFLYYVIIEALYLVRTNDSGEKELVGQLVAFYNMPVILLVGLLRVWILKPVHRRKRHLDVPYFIIPLLIMLACFVAWIWVGIFLAALAIALVVYEFIGGIVSSAHFVNQKESD